MQNTIIIKKHKDFSEIDKAKFKILIKNSFHKSLTKDYFEYTKPKIVIVAKDSKNYFGAIIVEEVDESIDYLDKIAVAKAFQGNGIGKKMWKLLNPKGKLVWRAKESNPINDFYKKQCDGMQKVKEWIVYWRGLNYDEIVKGLEYAVSKKETLEEIK